VVLGNKIDVEESKRQVRCCYVTQSIKRLTVLDR
jgi:hypothetical protein